MRVLVGTWGEGVGLGGCGYEECGLGEGGGGRGLWGTAKGRVRCIGFGRWKESRLLGREMTEKHVWK